MNGGVESGPTAIASAVGWIQEILLGTIASAIAVLAVASIGFLLLSGRIDFRRTTQVILGCFIVLGASTIAAGLMTALGSPGGDAKQAVMPPPPSDYPSRVSNDQNAVQPFDPYAGAAVQRQ